jgi:putative membrane protein
MNTQFISRKIWVAVLGAALLPMGAGAQQEDRDPSGTRSRSADSTTSATQQRITPQQFVQQAALSGLKEVRLGQIAVQKAQDSQVRQFAQQMIQDHSEANRKLTQIAQTKGYPVPDTNAFSRAGRTYVRDRETTPATPRTGREDTRNQEGTRPGTTGRQPGQTQQSQMIQQDIQVIQQLESMSGSEFDKSYINQMVQDHAKAVQKFETASETLEDEELKTFATETLPKLREHHQMAQQLAAQVGGAQNQPGQTQPGQTQPLQPQDRTPTEPRQPLPQNPNR